MGANIAANSHLTFRAGDAPLLGHPAGALDMAAALASGGAATAVRFVLMRGWVFRAAGSA